MPIVSRRHSLRLLAGSLAALVAPAAAAAQSSLQFELYKDSKAKFRWRLKAGNGKVMATSGEGYNAKADCKNAIGVIQKGAAGATIQDLTA